MNLNIIVVWCCIQAVSYPVLIACVNCRRYKVKGAKKKKNLYFFSKVKIIIIFFIEPVYLIKGQKSSLIQFGNQERKPAFFFFLSLDLHLSLEDLWRLKSSGE